MIRSPVRSSLAFAVALSVLALASPARAEERGTAAQPIHPQIGLGVSLNAGTNGDLLSSITGATAPVMIHVPINLGLLRVEPALGIFTFDEDGGTTTSIVSLGCGAFYVLRPAREFTTYAGPRLTLGFVSEKVTTGQKASGTDVRFDAAVGGEWWAGPSFALGVEARLGFLSVSSLATGGLTLRPGASSFQTGGALMARYYF